MSLHRSAILMFLLLLVLICAASSSAIVREYIDEPSDLSSLFKRKDAAIPYDLSESLLKSMLKYRRY